MTAAVVVSGVGLAFEVVGLGIALPGFIKTHRDFGTDAFFHREIALARRAGRTIDGTLRRLMRRPQRGKVVGAASIGLSVTAGRARVRVSYGPLPSPVESPDDFRAEVERRINDVHAKAQQAREEIGDESEAREKADQHVRADLEAMVDAVEDMSRSVAVGGLRLQVYGWSLVVVGVALQAVSTFMQALD